MDTNPLFLEVRYVSAARCVSSKKTYNRLVVALRARFLAVLESEVALEIAIAERLSAFPSRLQIAPVLELLQFLFVVIRCCSPGQVVPDNFPMDHLFVESLVLCYSELTQIEVFRPGKDSGFET